MSSRPSPPAPLPAARGEGSDYAPASPPSYDKAVVAFRSSPGFHFELTIGKEKASGELTRPRIGQEVLRFKSGSDEWLATRNATGVVWQRNGKPEKNEPAFADAVYQWIVMFNDPQKSPTQITGDHLEFKNLNTNETVSVWLTSHNHITRIHTSGSGSAFPSVDLAIEEPKS